MHLLGAEQERPASEGPTPVSYRIELILTAHRELMALPAERCTQLERAVNGLKSCPRPAGVRKLQGALHGWRVRVGPLLRPRTAKSYTLGVPSGCQPSPP